MSEPQGMQVSMDSVIKVQKETIARLMEENVLLQAALADRERQAEMMQRQE